MQLEYANKENANIRICSNNSKQIVGNARRILKYLNTQNAFTTITLTIFSIINYLNSTKSYLIITITQEVFGMELKGIDLSEHNIINWNQYANLDFVILRAGYGRLVSQKDKLFEQHYANAKSRGIKVGIYWYSYAKTATEAITEAKCCLEIIKGKEIDYPVYFDIEESSQKALGKDTCSAMVRAFCATIEDAGYAAGFYCNLDFYNTVIHDFIKKRFTCWLAQWDVTKPSIDVPLWQYHVDSVDHDIAYVDFSTWHKKESVEPKKWEFPIEIKIGDDTYIGTVTEK